MHVFIKIIQLANKIFKIFKNQTFATLSHQDNFIKIVEFQNLTIFATSTSDIFLTKMIGTPR